MRNTCKGTLDTPAHRLLDKYVRVGRLQQSVIEREINDTGVYRSQHKILMYVEDHPNASQKDIAGLYGVSPATVAVSLKKLERGGYIRKNVDQHDNRINQICLTDLGRRVVADSCKLFRKMEEQMFEGFSEEDFSVMGELFERIYENLLREFPARTEREDL